MSKTSALPIPAATVVVLRDHPPHGIEVFMVRRGQKMKFMAGAFVFPGGRLDESDTDSSTARWITGPSEAVRFQDLDPSQATAYHVAAVRELFEEAGILLARDSNGALVGFSDPSVQSRFNIHRADVHAGRRTLRSVVEEEHLTVAADELVPFAHWVTPRVEPRRFDTRFFLVRVPHAQEPAHDLHETTEGVWMSPRQALDRCSRDEIVLGPPTWCTLSELAGFESVAAVLSWGRGRVIVRTELEYRHENGVEMLLLRDDPLHDGITPVTADDVRFILEHGTWRARSPLKPERGRG